MNCFDTFESLCGKSASEQIYILAGERNRYAKSRQAWITAAYMMRRGDCSEFDRLVVEELCPTCIEYYEKI